MLKIKIAGVFLVLMILTALAVVPVAAQGEPTLKITLGPESGFAAVTIRGEIIYPEGEPYQLGYFDPVEVYWDNNPEPLPIFPDYVIPQDIWEPDGPFSGYVFTTIAIIPEQASPGNHTLTVVTRAFTYDYDNDVILELVLEDTANFQVINMEGPRGATGPVGPEGVSGPTGPAGPAGHPGPQGETGAKGAKGDTGPRGPAGYMGAEGPQGERGPAGATGVAGLVGTPAMVTGISALAFIMASGCIVMIVMSKLKKWVAG